jgi:DNA-binding MarR family transcriptional regulator
MSERAVDPAELDLMYLAHFVGLATNAAVRGHLETKGFRELRDSHGFIIQHLLRGPHSIGELAGLLGITQQAVSKSVAQLARNGYVQDAPSDDARVRKLRLSARGRSLVQATRTLRRDLEVKLSAKVGEAEYKQAKSVLLAALNQLDAVDAIRERKVRP